MTDIPSEKTVKKNWKKLEKYLIETRYSVRGKNGDPIEHSYDDVIKRVADWITGPVLKKVPQSLKSIIKHDSSLEEIYKALTNKAVVPASPVLMNGNASTRRTGYFSCYPLGYIEDSMEGIFDKTAILMKDIYLRAGGSGITLSKLRPKGSLVDGSQGYSSGPVAFLDVYGAVAGSVSQGGRRRGALMANLSEQHPDWMEFIWCKANRRGNKSDVLDNMNISLDIEENLREKVVDEVAKCIWECGDPGLIFIKNAYANTPIPLELEPRFVNPCAEYFSIAKTACNLISINLPLLAEQYSNDECGFFNALADSAYNGTIFGTILLYQYEGYPSDEIANKTMQYRPVGVGMLGLHGAMIRFGYKYTDFDFAEKCQAAIAIGSMKASADMVEETKDTVPCNVDWMKEFLDRLYAAMYLHVDSSFISTTEHIRSILDEFGSLYNIVTTVQAPTGSISQLVHSATNGVEPLYSIHQTRGVRDLNGMFEKFDLYPLELIEKTEEEVRNIDVAHNIDPYQHIGMMSKLQRLCHTAISKTVNMSSEATVDNIKDYIYKAFDDGLKSITFYRDGSKDAQILSGSKQDVSKINDKVTEAEAELDLSAKDKFPVKRSANIYTVKAGNRGNCHVTISKVENVVREVFIEAGDPGTVLQALVKALGKAISIALRSNPRLLKRLVETFQGIDSNIIYTYPGKRFKSIPGAVAYFMLEEYSKTEADSNEPVGDYMLCPECGLMTYRRKGQCNACENCGYETC